MSTTGPFVMSFLMTGPEYRLPFRTFLCKTMRDSSGRPLEVRLLAVASRFASVNDNEIPASAGEPPQKGQ